MKLYYTILKLPILHRTNIHSDNISEKLSKVSDLATEQEIGARKLDIADVFFHEVSKREIGRLKCLENSNQFVNRHL
jgi:hypothetical protein